MRISLGFLLGLVITGLLGAPTALAQAPASPPVRITYLTGSSAYIDAGRQDGLGQGDTLRVLRGGARVAGLRVEYLASGQAACAILDQTAPLVVGDTVDVARRSASPVLAADSAAAGEILASRRRPPGPGLGLRGRIGARYLGVWQRDAVRTHFSQPSLDLRLDGEGVGGAPIGIMLDLRTRRTATARPDGTTLVDGRTRVYRGALALGSPGGPLRLTAGRQYSTAVSSVSLFDGAQAELRMPSWTLGLFGGTEPAPVDLAYSNEIRDYGAYIRLHNRADAGRYWSATMGGVGSYTQGVTNREFLFAQGTYSDQRFSFYLTQEIDHYREWKQALGESPWSFTSTFGSLRYEVTSRLSLNAGYDNRRSVRLYRDVITPETTFDDTFRQGVWGGVAFRFPRARVALDARSSAGGTAGRTVAYTLSAALTRVAGLGMGLRSRTTRYDGPRESGWLQAVDLDFAPIPSLLLTVNGGVRLANDPLADPTGRTIAWIGTDLDLNLGRRWYLNASVTHETGALERNDQVYGGLSYRF